MPPPPPPRKRKCSVPRQIKSHFKYKHHANLIAPNCWILNNITYIGWWATNRDTFTITKTIYLIVLLSLMLLMYFSMWSLAAKRGRVKWPYSIVCAEQVEELMMKVHWIPVILTSLVAIVIATLLHNHVPPGFSQPWKLKCILAPMKVMFALVSSR